MPTLTGFTRPSDPIDSAQLSSDISTAVGSAVTVVVTPTDVQVTGASISEANRTTIQTALNSYYYRYLQAPGVPLVDNPDMSTARHNMAISEYAAYQADLLTRRKNWVSGALKNDSFIYVSKANTAGGAGAVTFYITDNGLSSGNAIFTNVYSDSVAIITYGASGNYQASTVTVAADKKSISAVISQITTVLGLLTFNSSAANGIDCRLYVMGD